MIRKILLFFGIYDLRKEGIRWCKKEFGDQYGDEFAEKYDNLNRGIPIGGITETAVFLDMVERIRSELEDQSYKKFFKKKKDKKVDCVGCIHLAYNNDGSVECMKGISEAALKCFNEDNIRPFKEMKK